MPDDQELRLRTTVTADDCEHVRAITRSSGFFTDPEVAVAVELVEERLAKGPASGYQFIFAEADGRTVGYSCFGPIPCTVSSYDLYWIAVDADVRGRRVGTRLLDESERSVARLGGTRVYVETSSRAQYEPTRRFYERRGYHRAALLEDFYAPGDGKVMYVKVL